MTITPVTSIELSNFEMNNQSNNIVRRRIETEYQNSVDLLRHYVDMLDNHFDLMTPTGIRTISNSINGITQDIRFQIMEVSNMDANVTLRTPSRLRNRPLSQIAEIDRSIGITPVTPVSSPPMTPERRRFQNRQSLGLSNDPAPHPESPENHIRQRHIDDVPPSLSIEDLTQLFESEDTSVTINEEPDYTPNLEEDLIEEKIRPQIVTKFCPKKESLTHNHECFYCFEKSDFHSTVAFQCNHKMCVDCISKHFDSSIERLPYESFYSCPECRAFITEINVKYTKENGKKEEMLNGSVVTKLRKYCK